MKVKNVLLFATLFAITLTLGCVGPDGSFCGNGICEDSECEVSCPEDCLQQEGSTASDGTTGDDQQGTTGDDQQPTVVDNSEQEEYFSDFFATCDVGVYDYSAPDYYFNGFFDYNDGRLTFWDSIFFDSEPEYEIDITPGGLIITPLSELAYEMYDYLPMHNLTVYTNATVVIDESSGNITTVNDTRPHEENTTWTVVYYGRNSSIVIQRDGHGLGNVSCGPASGTSLIDQINRSLNGTLVHSGNQSVINILRDRMNTTLGRGSTVWKVGTGILDFLNESGLAGNYTVKLIGNYTYANGSAWHGGTRVAGSNITWRSDSNITWIDYITELFLTEEFVVLRIVRTSDGQGHFVTADDLRLTSNAVFRRFISFMDPWDGDLKETELVGNCVQVWGTEWCIKDMISVSPVNP
jgi:hypothetical protein